MNNGKCFLSRSLIKNSISKNQELEKGLRIVDFGVLLKLKNLKPH